MFDGMVSGSFFGEFSDMGEGKNVCLDLLRVCLSVWVFCQCNEIQKQVLCSYNIMFI